jgi:flagellar biogenesis protein FliO
MNLMATETAIRVRVPARVLRVWVAAFWERILRLGRHVPRRLRLCESLPLGERRFVAVIEFDDARFLVGGTASSLVLLASLDGAGVANGDSCNPSENAVIAMKKPRGEPC